MAAEAGIPNPHRWSPEIERFSLGVTAAFDAVRYLDPSFGDQQFVIAHDGSRLRIRPFGVFGGHRLSDQKLSDGTLWVARSNVLQPSTVFNDDSLGELEDLMNSDAREAEFQRFLERHPEFILTLGDYAKVHPQLVLHEDDGRRLIPDFFLERLDSDLCDLCDLKLPTADLVRAQRNRPRFRDTVMEGVAQLSRYRNWFDDKTNRANFKAKYGLTAFRPRVVLVIGRRQSFYDDVQRITLESNLPPWIQLKTYDDVVARARRWRSLLVER